MSLGTGIWKSIRPKNISIIALTFFGMQFLIEAFPSLQSEQEHISKRLYFFLSLSVILLAAGGNVINDIQDVEVDAHNRAGKNPIPRDLGVQNAWSLYFIMTLSGLLIGMISLIFLKAFHFWSIHIFIAGSLWFYSMHMQRQPLIGNFIVALLCGLIPILILLYEQSFSPISALAMHGLIFYAIQAFLLTFMRELVKDLEDMDGDSRHGYRTFPVVMGISWTKGIVTLIGLLVIGIEVKVLTELSVMLPRIPLLTFFSLLFFVPLVFLFISLFKAHDKESFRSCARFLKCAMLAGLGSSLFFHFL
jgi:4-hydroxybenzoate polyprenyltransferase